MCMDMLAHTCYRSCVAVKKTTWVSQFSPLTMDPGDRPQVVRLGGRATLLTEPCLWPLLQAVLTTFRNLPISLAMDSETQTFAMDLPAAYICSFLSSLHPEKPG